MSGVLSLAGGSDSPSEAQDLMPEITEQGTDKMLSRPVGHYKMAQPVKQISRLQLIIESIGSGRIVYRQKFN